MRLTKEFVFSICVGGYYQFNVYKITDASHRFYYVGTPIAHGGTKIANTIEELRTKLEAEVQPLNDFLAKTR